MARRKQEQNELQADLGASLPLVPPLYQSSVYTLPDLDALDRIMDGAEPGYIYARDAHPNARRLAEQLAQLEGGTWAAIGGSGMASISAVILATLQAGDRIVASNRLYGRTTQLFAQELTRFGIETAFVDCCDVGAVRNALEAKRTKLLFVETMSNPMLRLVDLPTLIALAREHDCYSVVDNTFATPILTRPLDLGADFVMESLTKMIGGHSDVTLGLLASRNKDLLPQVTAAISIWGLASNPFDCWLAERGLATLPLRMRTASANAAALAEWLPKQRGVCGVYPGLANHPDHEMAQSLLGDHYGNMLCFELDGGRNAVNRLLRRAPGIPFSPSLGNTTTTLSHPATTSHRYVSAGEKRRQGITDGLIRLSVGVEDVEVIKETLAEGL